MKSLLTLYLRAYQSQAMQTGGHLQKTHLHALVFPRWLLTLKMFKWLSCLVAMTLLVIYEEITKPSNETQLTSQILQTSI